MENNHICPNCGHKTEGNYCSQCGQKNHLHKDTFVGLISHYFADYFHYDSKFWGTIKTLCFKPGVLTIAYREKKRMRYLPPISLYIFISVFFFLLSSSLDSFYIKHHWVQDEKWSQDKKETKEPIKRSDANKTSNTVLSHKDSIIQKRPLKRLAKMMDKASMLMDDEKVGERMDHDGPKIFFLIIPFLALLLSLFFLRRKEMLFVDHAVFAIHFQCFFFALTLIPEVFEFLPFYNILGAVCYSGVVAYFIVALHKVYHIGWLKSIFYSIFILAFYFAIFTAVFLGIVLYLYG